MYNSEYDYVGSFYEEVAVIETHEPNSIHYKQYMEVIQKYELLMEG